MCEPYHSIVQYPDDFDDSGLAFEGLMDKESRLKAALGKAMDWGKKIKKWFHFSKLGAGHSVAIDLRGLRSLYLPISTKYEGNWWDRTFHLDGFSRAYDKEEALEVAKQYHNNVVFRDIRTFRRFLEASLIVTTRPHLYIPPLLSVFSNRNKVNLAYGMIKRGNKESAIRTIMGLTRDRRNFLPHFSDDEGLWT